MERQTIGMIGLGLIGASMCKALAAAGHRTLGRDTDEHTMKYALLDHTVEAELTEENLPECDFLFLAVYPQAAVEALRTLAPQVRPGTVVADLCGVKQVVCGPCRELAQRYGFTFIGAHPMAGRQFSGIKYATADLFKGAPMILIPRENEDLFQVSRFSELIRQAGCGSVTVTTAENHDRMIAFTSQLAHVVANAYVKSPTARELKNFAGGSFRDLTRVAWLNEKMWTELFLENAEDLGQELDHLISSLSEYRDAIAAGDAQRLEALLRAGRIRKEELDAEWKK